ncbi:MAG: hypothetical protein AMXMBFR20_30370 [Planctomycetia bacterium]
MRVLALSQFAQNLGKGAVRNVNVVGLAAGKFHSILQGYVQACLTGQEAFSPTRRHDTAQEP